MFEEEKHTEIANGCCPRERGTHNAGPSTTQDTTLLASSQAQLSELVNHGGEDRFGTNTTLWVWKAFLSLKGEMNGSSHFLKRGL